MKITIELSRREHTALKNVGEGIRPFVKMAGIDTSGFDPQVEELQGGIRTSFSVDKKYTEKVFNCYGQFLPAIGAAFMSLATAFRGMALQLAQIDQEAKREEAEKNNDDSREPLGGFTKPYVA